MKSEIKKLWVKALRSGKYKKATGRLRTKDNKFCCLGVLCNLHAETHPKTATRQRDPGYYLGSSVILPETVRRWAGLPSNNGGYVTVNGTCSSLTIHNDTGATFKQIARAIEQQL